MFGLLKCAQGSKRSYFLCFFLHLVCLKWARVELLGRARTQGRESVLTSDKLLCRHGQRGSEAEEERKRDGVKRERRRGGGVNYGLRKS